MTIVRYLKESDIDAIVEMGAEMADESPRYRDYGFSADVFRDFLLKAIGKDDVMAIIAEREGRAVGFMFAVAIPCWFAEKYMAAEMALYVKKESRGSRAAMRLIDEYIDWAKSHGVDKPIVGVSTGINDETAVRLYSAMGFEIIGQTMEYQANV